MIIAMPAAVHLLRLIPLPRTWKRKATTIIGYSALWRGRHAVPLPYDLGILPTFGQAIFICVAIVINVIYMTTGYRVHEPNIWDQTAVQRLIPLVADRAGALSFANLVLIMICCSRNVPILHVTKWTYNTMLLYHRWIAYICITEAVIHSGIYVYQFRTVLAKMFARPYWNWGVAATILICLIVPCSVLPLRKRTYEFFVDSHIVLSIAVFIGCYYHIYMVFQHERGYETWVYLAIFLWIIDRVLRAVKVAANGVHTSLITPVDDEYLRMDIPDVKGTGYAHLYFPGLSWRLWQNHPFSIVASVHDRLLYEGPSTGETDDFDEDRPLLPSDSTPVDEEDCYSVDSLPSKTSTAGSSNATPKTNENFIAQTTSATGLTFYFRRHHGITAKLFNARARNIKVLAEGPYHPVPIPNLATYPTLICIAGGVGITALLPVLRSHSCIGRSALYWSTHSEALVEAVELDALRHAHVDVQVKIGERWDVHAIVRAEARNGVGKGDVVVMVSGPNGMADAVRAAVVRVNLALLSKRGRVRLVEECFSW
jgi:hypothetical protein